MAPARLALGCVLALAFALLYARHDWLEIYWRDATGLAGDLNHRARLLVRAGFVLVVTALVAWPDPRLAAWASTLLAVGTAFALPFQVGLNVDRGKSWDYLGAGAASDALLTRLFGHLAGKAGAGLLLATWLAGCAWRLLLG